MQNEINWFVIVNPAAGNGAVRRLWPELESVFLKKISASSIVQTDYPYHSIELVDKAVKQGFRHFIAVGGDGTNHEMVNGIMQQKTVPSTDITYTLLPVGTGNDWIRTFGIPKQIDKWLQMLARGNTRIQDVGHLYYYSDKKEKQRYFANVAGLAYDGFVVRYIERNKRMVRSSFIYLFMIVRCLFKYKLRKARIFFDGQENEGYHYTINAGVCKYSGGGMSVVPHAVPDDGQIALTIAGKISKLGVLANTWRFYNDSLTQHKKIDAYHVQEIRVEAVDEKEPILVEADGEFLGQSPVRISLVKKALRVVVP